MKSWLILFSHRLPARRLGVAAVVMALAVSTNDLVAGHWNRIARAADQGRRTTAERPREDGGVIRGQVTAADSGKPLSGVLVVASSAGLQAKRAVNTDESGWFEFRGLPPGRFILTASRTRYATMQFGARDDQLEGVPIDIGESPFTAAHFRLLRGGVVSGRISDQYGDAAIDVPVAIARVRHDKGQRRIVTVRSGRTDDLGRYRLWGLMSGEYVIVSNPTLRDVMTSVGDVLGQRAFYPGVPSLERAAAVRVRAGEEGGSLDFRIEPMRHAVLTVRVTDSMNKPARQTQLWISEVQPETGAALSGPVVTTDAEGKAVVPRVVAGLYRVAAATRVAGASSEVGTTEVVVDQVDTECWIRLSTATLIRGSVSVAPGLPAPDVGRLAIRMPGADADVIDLPPESPEGLRNGVIQRNGTFEVAVIGGRRFIQVTGLPQGWAVASVQIGREEWVGRPLDVTAGEVIENVRVVLTNQLFGVSGTAVDAHGNRSPGARAVLLPKDSSQWGNGLVVSERANQNGDFRIRSVRPGAYWIVAAPQTGRLDLADRRYLEALLDGAAPLTVDSGRDGLKVIVRSDHDRH